MYSSFKVKSEVQIFDLLFHKVAVLDAAGKLAHEERDIEQLLDIAERIGYCSDEFIQVNLLLSEDGEEGECCDGEESRGNPVGFQLTQD